MQQVQKMLHTNISYDRAYQHPLMVILFTTHYNFQFSETCYPQILNLYLYFLYLYLYLWKRVLIIFYWWIRRMLRQASTCFPQFRIICLFVQIAAAYNNDKIIPEIYYLLFFICPPVCLDRHLQIMRLNISWKIFRSSKVSTSMFS